MKKDFFKGLVTGLVAAFAVMSVVIGIGKYTDNKEETLIDSNFEAELDSIVTCLDTFYLDYDKLEKEKLQTGMFKGLMEAIDDDYSMYYTKEEYEDFKEDNTGKYSGIGAYVSQNLETGLIVIVNPFEGGPAHTAGIKPGDIISAVDDVSVSGMNLNDVVALMKGEPETIVKVSVVRDGEVLDFDVTRNFVDVPTVSHNIIEDGKIGYIYISSFDQITLTQFREALDDIESKGAKGLILDVRDNGGGRLDTVLEMLDRILPECMLMYTETRDGSDSKYYSTDEESCALPMVVLINGYSASASEVFAGALKDHKAATVIGTKSFGKGIVQSIYTLNGFDEGPAVKFTTSRYYTPNGINIHGTGIEPDITIEYDRESLRQEDGFAYDNQIEKAVEELNKKIK